MRTWLRGQGHTVPSRGRVRGQLAELYYEAYPERRPEGSVRLLPGPDMDDDEIDAWEDLGELAPDGPESNGDGRTPPAEYAGEPPPPGPDPEPAHARKEWRRAPSKKTPGKPVRVTAGLRDDIEGKVSLLLDIPGRAWAIRDPICGGRWVEQVPAMAAAWTRYICQSPQLVEWFTSSGAGFIAVFDIIAATYPVVVVVMAHHVYHSIGEQAEDATQPDYGRYAA